MQDCDNARFFYVFSISLENLYDKMLRSFLYNLNSPYNIFLSLSPSVSIYRRIKTQEQDPIVLILHIQFSKIHMLLLSGLFYQSVVCHSYLHGHLPKAFLYRENRCN